MTATKDDQVTTNCGVPLKVAYGPDDIDDLEYRKDLGDPGEAPFTRGPYPEMYRDRLWRIFQLTGYGLPEDAGKRIKFMLEHGETGFILEPDLMTVYGMLDIDDPDIVARKEEVGLYGATLLSLREYERALEGIPIEKNYAHPGGVTPVCSCYCHACYFAVAEKRGIPLKDLGGTGEGDFFLSYLATPIKKVIPPEAALRLNCDLIEFCTEHMPRWMPVSIPGTNARETGMNNYQQVAISFANAIAYIDEVLRRGRFEIDDFARNIGGFGFCPHTEFFEDIATYRAARRVWYKLLTERYGARNPRSAQLRIHVNVGGSTSTYQQPLNNIVRGTIGMMAAALGGVQSAGVTAFDEAICIPSEQAHLMSLRTQQILQLESGISKVADPLGGSYYVESLTNEMEKRIWDYMDEIEDQGGLIAVLNSGWAHREAHAQALEKERQIMANEKKVVGVNCYQMDEEPYEIPVFRAPEVYEIAKARDDELRRTRDNEQARRAMEGFRRALDGGDNVMPPLMEAVKASATSSEIGNVQREVLGTWKPPLPI
jgi:methylmalonyl-CoA mutase N-terminal domain/subunit